MGVRTYVSELWMKKLLEVIKFLHSVKGLWRKKHSDVVKFLQRCWEYLQTAFTSKKDFGKEERESQWTLAQRTYLWPEKRICRELFEMAELAKKRAEIARLRELHTLKGRIESVMKLKGLDIELIQQHYSV